MSLQHICHTGDNIVLDSKEQIFNAIMLTTFDTTVSSPRLCALLIKGMFLFHVYVPSV